MARVIKFEDKNGNPETLDKLLPYDEHTNGLVIVDHAHHEIHESLAFTCIFTDIVMANAETIILAFKTMASPKYMHFTAVFSTLVGGYFQIWEGVTWTTNTGTVLPVICRNRAHGGCNSAVLEDLTATPKFTATHNILSNVTGLGTGSATGLLSGGDYAFGDKGKITADSRGISEYVLMPDTQYAVVFTAIGASNMAQITLDWYEHSEVG